MIHPSLQRWIIKYDRTSRLHSVANCNLAESIPFMPQTDFLTAGSLAADESRMFFADSDADDSLDALASDEVARLVRSEANRNEMLAGAVQALRKSLWMAARYEAMRIVDQHEQCSEQVESVAVQLRVLAKNTIYQLRVAATHADHGAFTSALHRFWNDEEFAALLPLYLEAMEQFVHEIDQMAAEAVKEVPRAASSASPPASNVLFLDMEHAYGRNAVWQEPTIEKMIEWAMSEAHRRGKVQIIVETEPHRFGELETLLKGLSEKMRDKLSGIQVTAAQKQMLATDMVGEGHGDFSPADRRFVQAALAGKAC